MDLIRFDYIWFNYIYYIVIIILRCWSSPTIAPLVEMQVASCVRSVGLVQYFQHCLLYYYYYLITAQVLYGHFYIADRLVMCAVCVLSKNAFRFLALAKHYFQHDACNIITCAELILMNIYIMHKHMLLIVTF